MIYKSPLTATSERAEFVRPPGVSDDDWSDVLAEVQSVLCTWERRSPRGPLPDHRAPVLADKTNPRHGTIPWSVHLRVWQAYAAAGHGDQSAERIAERGGFSYDECQRWLAQGARAFRDPRPADLPPLEGWEPR